MIEKMKTRIRQIDSQSREISKWLKNAFGDRTAVLWLTMITAIGLGLRGYFMARPMHYDESYTFLNFVDGPWYRAFFYPLPNNHILHTILVRVSVGVFGAHPVTIRLPAVAAGVCAIPSSFLLARLTVGEKSGLLTAALVAVFPYLVLYDTMARGYSLLVLLSIWLAILLSRFRQKPDLASLWWMSLAAACGFLTMPSFLFPAAGLLTWILVTLPMSRQRWVLMRMLVPYGAITLTLTGIFYGPTIVLHSGIHTIVGNRFVKALPWNEFFGRLPKHVMSTVRETVRNVPLPLLIAGLFLYLIGLYLLAYRRCWNALALIPGLSLGASAVLVAKHTIPYPRTWIYSWPFAFLFVDVGFVRVTRFVSKRAKGILLLLTACSGVLLMSHNMVASYPRTGYFPEAPVVVDFICAHMRSGDELVIETPANWPLYFYLWYKGVPLEESLNSEARRKFFVVQKGEYSLRDLTEHDAPKLLDIAGAEVYVLEVDGPSRD